MRALAAFFVLMLGAAAASAQEVDLELVLLADASGSIDESEIAFQRGGYAGAITDPAILAAITGGALQKIAITYVEWGSVSSQDVVVAWTIIDGERSARAFADALISAPRKAHGRNAIGNALAVAEALLESNAFKGTRKVIDFSGDSAYSWGGVPVALARMNALAKNIVINGLAILCRDCTSGRPVNYDLEKAFADTIIGGPGSFVITAETRATFADAVRRKLLLEIAGRASDRKATAVFERPMHGLQRSDGRAVSDAAGWTRSAALGRPRHFTSGVSAASVSIHCLNDLISASSCVVAGEMK